MISIRRALCVPLLAALVAVAPAAGAAGYEEDVHYERIAPAQPTEAPAGQIEVVEVFWYGCPHCFDFEPTLSRWLQDKPADVFFRRLPGVFNENWAIHARAYYALEKLGGLEATHSALFHAIHEERQRLFDQASLADFYATKGVDKEAFNREYDSFAVEGKVLKAAKLAKGYGITGVPAVIVNGRYRTSATLAGGYDELLKVVAFLVDKEREESAGAQ